MEILRQYKAVTGITVANGADVSSPINKGGYAAVAIGLPAALTSTSIGWEVSMDGSTFFTYCEAGAAYAETVAANQGITSPAGLFPWTVVRLKLNANEAAARSLAVGLSG